MGQEAVLAGGDVRENVQGCVGRWLHAQRQAARHSDCTVRADFTQAVRSSCFTLACLTNTLRLWVLVVEPAPILTPCVTPLLTRCARYDHTSGEKLGAKARSSARTKRYNKTKKGKATQARRNQSDNGKSSKDRYEQTAKGQATRQRSAQKEDLRTGNIEDNLRVGEALVRAINRSPKAKATLVFCMQAAAASSNNYSTDSEFTTVFNKLSTPCWRMRRY